jgi:hypothetical protein
LQLQNKELGFEAFRYIFRYPNNEACIEMKTDKLFFSPNEEVNLSIETFDKDYNELETYFFLSVVDESVKFFIKQR